MILRSISTPIDFRYSFLPVKNPALLHRSVRLRRRRPTLRVHSVLEDLFHNLVSAFPSPTSLDLLAPVLGFASGAALYVASRSRRGGGGGVPDAVVGDWILFTSPTPFNRCVLLRCPSVSFEDGGELLEGVNDRLVREERHYVNLSRGRIPAARLGTDEKIEEDEVSYQRVCVGTEDGGVISLDWPDNLDIAKEHGLDTTMVIVPGVTEGSMDRNVRMFVIDALKHGYFPIVMNPRGCASSPLTTARLFTAADSDDICTAIGFINRLRPWTTLMGVGWGYGANMLTKYLAEVEETTPLTAAVCIDNPFDLAEATRSFPHHIALDQKLTSGLIDILQSNKELFQGKAKGFDVGKALSATSIRDFDEAVSMISYGCHAVEDFYSKISTRQSVSSLKIPVLFIQTDDGTVPLFSVPRSSIAENPFTSLLLCSCLPSTIVTTERSAILWCQNLAIEWLSAVELALLKGRHPLLKDVDITINPSKGLAFVDGIASKRSISDGSSFHVSYDPSRLFLGRKSANGIQKNDNVLKEGDGAVQDKVNSHSKSRNELREMQKNDNAGIDTDKNVEALQPNGAVNASWDIQGDGLMDSENSQVLQTAAAVMNMLDVTTPGTLDDEQKQKVLTAVEQGETLMKALEGAVPEDVRGKLTSAVTEILQTQSTNLNIDGLKRIGWLPNLTSELKSRIQGKRGTGSEEKAEDDLACLNSGNNNTQERSESSQEKSAPDSGHVEAGAEVAGKSNQPNKFEKGIARIDEAIGEQQKVNQSSEITEKHSAYDQVAASDANDVHNNEAKKVDPAVDQNKQISSTNTEEALSDGSSASVQQVTEKAGNEITKKEEKVTQDMVDQNIQSSSTKSEESWSQHPSSKSPSINVTQALEALTGFDDSTQMAVNSVFGVIENMIDQLEKTSNQSNDDEIDKIEDQKSQIDDEVNKIEDQESRIASHDFPPINETKYDCIEDSDNRPAEVSNASQPCNQVENNLHEVAAETHEGLEDKWGEDKLFASSGENSISQSEECNSGGNYIDGKNLNMVGCVQKFPLNVVMNSYWGPPYATYLHRYLSAQSPIMKSSDLNSTTDLFLDPEEGRWKMLDQAGNANNTVGESGENRSINGSSHIINAKSEQGDMEQAVEPSYIILDTEFSRFEKQQSEELNEIDDSIKQADAKKEELIGLIRNALLEALKVEVARRLGMPDSKKMDSSLVCDLEQVSDAVSRAVVSDDVMNLNSFSESDDTSLVNLSAVEGEHIIKAIYSAVQDASHLRKVLPVGVIVGSSLASLRKYFQVASLHDDVQSKTNHQSGNVGQQFFDQERHIRIGDQHSDTDSSLNSENETCEIDNSNNKGIMVGAVTAALGASALLARHEQNKSHKYDEALESPSALSNEKGFPHLEHAKLEEAVREKNQDTLVTSLAEKAMSVAGPVVPTRSDGEVDQERLVAILAELGQKGGMLRLVGKIALLWGGLRGAMSLTDRLISFLRIAERPLFQRSMISSRACWVE
ncbi:uncharacterized protein [Elaeis guineensis]|uniref:uncharacterized protein isoform X2 n=1 Tax=Elaeis guineensis var. tenera TaxID=51953 RepID=UPI003C6CF211